jgi:hypothetical protein
MKSYKKDGAIAQLGERLLCKQDVVGSIPSGSTILLGFLVLSLNEIDWRLPIRTTQKYVARESKFGSVLKPSGFQSRIF